MTGERPERNSKAQILEPEIWGYWAASTQLSAFSLFPMEFLHLWPTRDFWRPMGCRKKNSAVPEGTCVIDGRKPSTVRQRAPNRTGLLSSVPSGTIRSHKPELLREADPLVMRGLLVDVRYSLLSLQPRWKRPPYPSCHENLAKDI